MSTTPTKDSKATISDTLNALLYREQEIQNTARRVAKILDPLGTDTQKAVLELLTRTHTTQNPPKMMAIPTK